MRVLIQRVKKASVCINQMETRYIDKGLLLFLGIETVDTVEDLDWLCVKTSKLRIFDDAEGIMNHSILDIAGDAMLISQFTLHAKTKKGNRPSYIAAAAPEIAEPLYSQFAQKLSEILNKKVITGEFGAHMDVGLINDGPVSIWIDTKNKE